MEQSEILQLGALGILFFFAIKEFFGYLKAKKTNGNGMDSKILSELQLMNNNHLEHLRQCVEESNRDLKDTIHSDNIELIKIVSRIEGKLK